MPVSPMRSNVRGKSILIFFIDRIAIAKPVQVRPAPISNRVPVEELAGAGVVVAVRQAQQARLHIRVVAELAAEACRVLVRLRLR